MNIWISTPKLLLTEYFAIAVPMGSGALVRRAHSDTGSYQARPLAMFSQPGARSAVEFASGGCPFFHGGCP